MLSRVIPKLTIADTTFIKALVAVGRTSGLCLGVVLHDRSAAQTVIPKIDVERITLSGIVKLGRNLPISLK
jgi:hypothetical protein